MEERPWHPAWMPPYNSGSRAPPAVLAGKEQKNACKPATEPHLWQAVEIPGLVLQKRQLATLW